MLPGISTMLIARRSNRQVRELAHAARPVLAHIAERGHAAAKSAAKMVSGAMNSSHPREKNGKFARK